VILGPSDPVTLVRAPPGVKRASWLQLMPMVRRGVHPLHAAAMASGLPLHADLSAYCGRRKNQGQSSACAAHSGTTGLLAAQYGAGVASPVDPSPWLAYVVSGMLEAPGGPLLDDGRTLPDVVSAFRSGIIPMRAPTPDGRWSDVWTAADTGGASNVCTPPTAADFAARVVLPFDYGNHTIDPHASNMGDLVVASLTCANPAPVWVAGLVGRQFDTLNGDAIAQPATGDPSAGGHATLIVGFRTMADGSRQYLDDNSWGEEWDNDGECWTSEAWLASQWELHPLTMTPRTEGLTVADRMRSLLSRLEVF